MSQSWLGMGGQGIGVREVPGSIPGGGPLLLMVSVSNEARKGRKGKLVGVN